MYVYIHKSFNHFVACINFILWTGFRPTVRPGMITMRNKSGAHAQVVHTSISRRNCSQRLAICRMLKELLLILIWFGGGGGGWISGVNDSDLGEGVLARDSVRA